MGTDQTFDTSAAAPILPPLKKQPSATLPTPPPSHSHLQQPSRSHTAGPSAGTRCCSCCSSQSGWSSFTFTTSSPASQFTQPCTGPDSEQ